MSVMNPSYVCCFSWSAALWCFSRETSSFTQISIKFPESFHNGLKTLCYAFAFLGSNTLWSHFESSLLYIHNRLFLFNFQASSQGIELDIQENLLNPCENDHLDEGEEAPALRAAHPEATKRPRSRRTRALALSSGGAIIAFDAQQNILRIGRCNGSTRIHLWSEYPWIMFPDQRGEGSWKPAADEGRLPGRSRVHSGHAARHHLQWCQCKEIKGIEPQVLDTLFPVETW